MDFDLAKLKNTFNLSQFIYDFKASYVDQKSNSHFRSVLDTNMTVISGKTTSFFIGEEIQKEINTVSEGTNGSELVSDFVTEQAGLKLDMIFYQSKDYVIGKLDIEDTRFTGENKETGIQYDNHVCC